MARGKMEASAEVWADRVQRWKASGLTAKSFCEQEGIAKPSSLSWWQYHLKQKAKATEAQGEPTLKLIRLKPQEDAAPVTSPIDLVIGRCRISVGRGFDEATLRRVIA